jgi:hypothetical protein
MLDTELGPVIAFRIQLNRDHAVTAGLPGEHVVSIHADSRPKDPKYQPSGEPDTGLRMSVGGLRSTQGVHVRWLSAPLTVGDEIAIAVVDVPELEISPTIEETSATKGEGHERERLAYLLKKYGAPADR